ncbi:NADP-dependent oxidoreductase [Rossellomorea vietnamensis]|uniref:NADP-dependent oxidoreductase n=1 Tax=Rossellomorea TaxID=2837508 RepID=UPI001CC9B6EC|nr:MULTISPECIES: NADP-dependent oxidoreductase [Rossellomorea]MCA0150023.1 NADP-dependent oxidoreductase [Rossellomorea vietnamensis]UTE78200.1 NADP-dependent oxidoreductase [Rossellomorea sp. KS-H15a]
MLPEKQQQIQLVSRPEGMPVKEDFLYKEIDVPQPSNGEVLVKTIYLSVDPYMRGRMSDAKSYVEPFKLNEALAGGVVGEIVESKSEHFQKGDFVVGMLPWQEYSVAKEKEVRTIDPDVAPISTYLSILGMTGLTAYFGLMDIGQPKEGETVVVSGAAGAVGSVVGQIAKIQGARVVGIAGSDEKVSYLTDTLGFDEGINYKTTDNIYKTLKEACPDGIDVYFENVGGEIGDAALSLLNKHARIPVCGAISSYNKTDRDLGPRVQSRLIKSSALMKGFVVNDYNDRFKEGATKLGEWLSQGKLQYEETITEGLDNVTDAFLGLFQGKNIGKQLVKIAEPSK